MPFQEQSSQTVLLYRVSSRDKAKLADFIFPVINTQQGLEIRKGDKGMQRRGSYPGFVIHEDRVRGYL
jgi:hypothetical protein